MFGGKKNENKILQLEQSNQGFQDILKCYKPYHGYDRI